MLEGMPQSCVDLGCRAGRIRIRAGIASMRMLKPIAKSSKLANVCYDIRGPVLARAKQMEEDGHSLLIVDLLRLPARFSYRRFRLDVIGFGLAWLWVVLLLLLGYWVTRLGA